MGRGNATRCPGCGGFGSPSLGRYCKKCAPQEGEIPLKRSTFIPAYGTHPPDTPFFSDKFGIIKDKFGMER